MAKTVTVPALREFTYNGRKVAKGELVSMRPVDAAVHARKQNVTLSTGTYRTRVTVPESEPEPEPEPAPVRRRYRRRDLQAEK